MPLHAFLLPTPARGAPRRGRPRAPPPRCPVCALPRPPPPVPLSRRAFLAAALAFAAAPAAARARGLRYVSALEDEDVGESPSLGYRPREDVDPFNLYGRLAPREVTREGPVAPGAPDPSVRIGVFEGEEETEKKRMGPRSYQDALFARADAPVGEVLRTWAVRAAVVGGGVLVGVGGVNVAERATTRREDGLPIVYDRRQIARYCLQRPERVLARVGQFAWEVGGLLAVWGRDRVADALFVGGKMGRKERRRRRARRLREGISRLGPGVIKLGQAAATRPDLFGGTFASELQLLQDSIFQGFESEEAFTLIQKELGARRLEDVYAYIDPNPIAGASLGMVFRAWLYEDEDLSWPWWKKGGGDAQGLDEIELARPELRGKRKVAVKVQRPLVAELCSLDFFIIRNLAVLAGALLHVRTNLGDVVDEYASSVFEELNYVNEANNILKFRAMYGHGSPSAGTGNVSEVYVPRVYPMYSSRRVLTTEWVNAEPMTDGMARCTAGNMELVETGILSALDQCLAGGFVHCDQHSGNLMKLREPELYSNGGGGNGSNGKTGDCGHLVLVDFGICAEVPLYTRQSLACALMHLMHRDFESLADTFAGMSLMRATDLDAEVAELSVALKHAFHDVAPVSVKRFESAPATETTAGEASYRARLQRFTFIGVAERLISLSVSFPLVFGDYTISLLRCLSMLEGLAYNANPNFNIVDLVYPYVVSMVITGAQGTPFENSLRNLVVDSSGGPGTERVKLIALELLVRLSRPGVLISEHPTKTGTGDAPVAQPSRETPPTSQASIIRYALSRPGSLVRELALGQYVMDVASLCNSWVDRVLYGRPERAAAAAEGGWASLAQANVAVVHRVLRRERRSRLGPGVRLQLLRVRLWAVSCIGARVALHFFRRFAELLLRRPSGVPGDEKSSFADT